ncbi:MAG: L-rhamnose/proton symporter RhaT [Candidatus Omnitrophica bacterium]|nr:L-rhamnose/proton symporter RhaT [Candidatus Omnitrophota bacterium]
MEANPMLGVFLHAVGGLAAGSFYLPFKKVRGWSWETYWAVGGVFSWIIAPLVAASLLNPRLFEILSSAPAAALFNTYLFGVLWGVGGLTFGLTMRYLGLSLGYALALGLCATFGTLLPPLFEGTLGVLLTQASGWAILLGVCVCIAGIGVSGWAGVLKERELSVAEKANAVAEYQFTKGVWVAVFCGIMSACMAFAFQAGKPIAGLAIEMGTPDIWQNTPVLVVVLLGGFTTNLIWCALLHYSNGTVGEYLDTAKPGMVWNYIFSAIAGVTWYLQFFFYGMGTTRMGEYDFSSWSLHMAFIIVFSNLWGLWLREWSGTSPKAKGLLQGGIAVLILSTLIIGVGNYLKDATP